MGVRQDLTSGSPVNFRIGRDPLTILNLGLGRHIPITRYHGLAAISARYLEFCGYLSRVSKQWTEPLMNLSTAVRR
jgi:hypothetical protein